MNSTANRLLEIIIYIQKHKQTGYLPSQAHLLLKELNIFPDSFIPVVTCGKIHFWKCDAMQNIYGDFQWEEHCTNTPMIIKPRLVIGSGDRVGR